MLQFWHAPPKYVCGFVNTCPCGKCKGCVTVRLCHWQIVHVCETGNTRPEYSYIRGPQPAAGGARQRRGDKRWHKNKQDMEEESKLQEQEGSKQEEQGKQEAK